jgi:hypothetical protein
MAIVIFLQIIFGGISMKITEKECKKRIFLFGLLTLVLTFGLISMGCKSEPEPEPEPELDPTYTVWTDSTSYSEYSSKIGTLNDGYYVHMEMNNTQFNEMAPSLTSEGKHDWTESQIYNWFIGRGFGGAEANQEKAWLITTNHGFIASRSGTIVYMLLK